jgi:hypothetical protein
MWANGRTTHGDCESAAEAIRELPLTFDVAIQALCQVSDVLGGFLSESDDVYNDPKALQRALGRAYYLASEGIGAERIRREHCSN